MSATTQRHIAKLPITQYVYVLRETLGGPCKIGICRNLARRLAKARMDNPRRIELAFAAEHSLAAMVESLAHEMLAPHWKQGEWFNVTSEHAVQIVQQAIDVTDRGSAQQTIGELRVVRMDQLVQRTHPLALRRKSIT